MLDRSRSLTQPSFRPAVRAHSVADPRLWSLAAAAASLSLLLVAGAALNGCAAPALARGGSRLSDAVDVASRQSKEGERKERERKDGDPDHDRDRDDDRGRDERVVLRVAPERRCEVVHHHHGFDDSDRCADENDAKEAPGPALRTFVGASLDGVRRRDDAVEGGGRFAVHGGASLPHTRNRIAVEGELAVGWMDAAPTIAGGVHDLFEFTVGAAVRNYASSPHVGAGIYGTAGIRGGLLRWDYATPLLVDDGYDLHEVSEDYVATWAPFVGAGVTFFRDRPVHLDVGVLYGLQLYGEATGEGFRNDVFEMDDFTEVRVGLTGVLK